MLALAGCGGAAPLPGTLDHATLRVGVLQQCDLGVVPIGGLVAHACPATVDNARKLVEGDLVDVVLAFPDDEEGLALALYAETQPDIAFVDGSSGLPETTLDVQARNYYRLVPDHRQASAGYGTYAYRRLGRRSLGTVRGSDRYFRDAFVVEFCALGGRLGPPASLNVVTRVVTADPVTRLRAALRRARGNVERLREQLAQGLDGNRQVVVDVNLVRRGSFTVVATYRGVEQTFGGAFTEGDAPGYRPPCERRDPPPWSR